MTRRLAEIGPRGGALDVVTGGDIDPDTGRLMSIAQLQEALRRRNRIAMRVIPNDHRRRGSIDSPTQVNAPWPRHREGPQAAAPELLTALTPGDGTHATAHVTGATTPRAWLLVLGAHAGAGCSSTALAIADSAAVSGSAVHLVEAAQSGVPAGAGLAAVTHHELGVVPGGWRRGRRGRVTVDRPTSSQPLIWPPAPSDAHDGAGDTRFTILDAGALWAHDVTKDVAPEPPWWSAAGAPAGVVVVCRASAPGVAAAERAAHRAHDCFGDRHGRALPLVVAAVGGNRWRGPVKAAAGPFLSRLQEQHLVVGVPHQRSLEVSGLTSDPLPRSLTAAGRSLWTLATANSSTHTGGPR